MATLFYGSGGFAHGRTGDGVSTREVIQPWGRRDHARARRNAEAIENSRRERAALEREAPNGLR